MEMTVGGGVDVYGGIVYLTQCGSVLHGGYHHRSAFVPKR